MGNLSKKQLRKRIIMLEAQTLDLIDRVTAIENLLTDPGTDDDEVFLVNLGFDPPTNGEAN